MKYYLGPPKWYTEDISFYGPPEGTKGWIDLRNIPDQSVPNIIGNCGFFASDEDLDSDYILLGTGDIREIHTNGKIIDIWKSITGYKPSGDKLVDILFDHLTNGADPDGENACKPLMPTSNLNLDIHLNELVKRIKVDTHDKYWNKIVSCEQKEYKKFREQCLKNNSKDYLKFLKKLTEKYKIKEDDAGIFIPKGMPKEKPTPHNTTKTESWPSDGNITSGQDNTWTVLDQAFTVVSGMVRSNANNITSTARLDFDFSGSDLFAEERMSDNSSAAGNILTYGVMVRQDGTSTLTHYMSDFRNDTALWRTFRRVSGGFTSIGTNTSQGVSLNDIIKLEANGSTITRYKNGISQNSTTDTGITSGLRVGILSYSVTSASSYIYADDFRGGDIGGVEAVLYPWYYYRKMMG